MGVVLAGPEQFRSLKISTGSAKIAILILSSIPRRDAGVRILWGKQQRDDDVGSQIPGVALKGSSRLQEPHDLAKPFTIIPRT